MVACRQDSHGLGNQSWPHIPDGATPVQHYLPELLKHIEKSEIDPSFVITHRATLEEGPDFIQDVPRQERRLHQGRHEAVSGLQF